MCCISTTTWYISIKLVTSVFADSFNRTKMQEFKNLTWLIYNVNNAFLDLRQSNFDKHEERYYDLHWDEWWE